jgi:hypothetical protein
MGLDFGILATVMSDDSWKKMKNLYLAIQMGLHDPPQSSWVPEAEWKKMKAAFFGFTQDIMNNPESIKQDVNLRAREILTQLEKYITSHKLEEMEMYAMTRNLKLTHSMICSVVEHWSEVSPDSKWLRGFLTKANIVALDKEIKMFSDALLIIYHNYCELTQAWAHENLVEGKKFEKQDYRIYLSRVIHMGNGNYIDPQEKREIVEFLPSENTPLNVLNTNLSKMENLHDSWKSGTVPNQDEYFLNENNLGNILSHLADKHLKNQPSERKVHFADDEKDKAASNHSIPSQILERIKYIKHYSDATCKKNHKYKTIASKMYDFMHLLDNPIGYKYERLYKMKTNP